MKNTVVFCLTLLMLSSCYKMNDNFKEYLDRGEINYLGKVDSTSSRGGLGKIELRWKINYDPRIEYTNIYWNSGQDSAIIAVNQNVMDDRRFISTILNVPEGAYVFSMYNTGALGHRSIRGEVTGRSFGAKYQESLVQRRIRTVVGFEDRAVINFANPSEGMSKTMVTYESETGTKTLEVLANESQVTIFDHKPLGEISAITSYLPEPQALDEIPSLSEPVTGTFPKHCTDILDRSDWIITATSEELTGESNGNNGRAIHLIDGNVTTFWHSKWQGGTLPRPYYVTVDMQQVVYVYKIILRVRDHTNITYLVDVEISLDGNSWTTIGNFDVVQARGQDITYDTGSGYAQYLRLVIPDRAPQGSTAAFAELNVIGELLE